MRISVFLQISHHWRPWKRLVLGLSTFLDWAYILKLGLRFGTGPTFCDWAYVLGLGLHFVTGPMSWDWAYVLGLGLCLVSLPLFCPLTFGLLPSKAACVILLLPLRARRARGLQNGRGCELLGPWDLFVNVVRQVPHDTHTVLHRLVGG